MICNLIDKVHTHLEKQSYGIDCGLEYTDLLLESMNNNLCIITIPCEKEIICTPVKVIICNVTITQITNIATGSITITRI